MRRRAARRRPRRTGDRAHVRQTDARSPAALQRHRRDRRPGDGGRRVHRLRGRDLAQGLEVPVGRVADQRRPQAHRRHVHRAGADHAGARLRRRHHDARPAGDGAEQRRLPAARAFRPDLQLARHHHDLLHGHAVHDRADEHRGSAADRHARRRLPVPEFAQPVADLGGRRSGHGIAGDRQVLDRRLDRLSALLGHRGQPGRRRRLLDLGAPDQRRRLDPLGHQLHRHHPEAPRARDGPDAHDALHLDGALRRRS